MRRRSFRLKQLEFFENRIRPLFVNHCQDRVMASRNLKAIFALIHETAILKGGTSEEPAAISGNAIESLLLEVVSYDSDYDMPPAGKLSDQEISDLRLWVNQDLPWPEHEAVSSQETIADRVASQRKNHWAFQPVMCRRQFLMFCRR